MWSMWVSLLVGINLSLIGDIVKTIFLYKDYYLVPTESAIYFYAETLRSKAKHVYINIRVNHWDINVKANYSVKYLFMQFVNDFC